MNKKKHYSSETEMNFMTEGHFLRCCIGFCYSNFNVCGKYTLTFSILNYEYFGFKLWLWSVVADTLQTFILRKSDASADT